MQEAQVPSSRELLTLLRLSAEAVLANGGETYRVEETVERICKALGVQETEVLAIPTGVVITYFTPQTDCQTVLVRIKSRRVDLSKINAANTISRQIASGELNAAQAIGAFTALSKQKEWPWYISVLATGFSCGLFTLLFGGNVFDGMVSALCGFAVQLSSLAISRRIPHQWFHCLIGGVITAVITLSVITLTGMGNRDYIISGAIMPLLPGLAMTNAIRDTIHGDLVSGAARGLEALIVAGAIAAGVGLVLKIWLIQGGGAPLVG